jgi:hypothetical protein
LKAALTAAFFFPTIGEERPVTKKTGKQTTKRNTPFIIIIERELHHELSIYAVLPRRYRAMSAYAKRRNKTSEQWVSYPVEMLESPAFRALSQAAHMVVARIGIELAHHGGNDNGRLPVTFDQFIEYGLYRNGVAPAIREAEALGFIKVTEHGRGGNAKHRRPNLFYLTFANWRGSKAEAPTHEWKKVKTVEEAEQIATEARQNKDKIAVAKARAKRKPKHFPVSILDTGAAPQNRDRNAKSSSIYFRDSSVSPILDTTSISGVGEAKRACVIPFPQRPKLE